MKKNYNILVVDDHTIFSEGLTSLLSTFEQINTISSVKNGIEALEFIKLNLINLVITDVNMPLMDGVKFTKEVKIRFPHVKVLALSMHNETRIVNLMIKSGVDGYVLKDTNKQELYSAIDSIIMGNSFYSNSITLIKENKSNDDKQKNLFKNQIDLSAREIEVLKLISEGDVQQIIANKLFISQHTVIFHRRNLLQKFDAKNTAELIKIASAYGLI